MFGLTTLYYTNRCKSLSLTDGNASALALAQANYELLRSQKLHDTTAVNFHLLDWSNYQVDVILQEINNSRPFDVVVGCELIYYRTDVTQFARTAHDLVAGQGLFVHAHVIRQAGQGRELVSFLSDLDWLTVEVPIQSFVDSQELDSHPEWINVRCLVSGPSQRISSLQLIHPTWKLFVEEEPTFVYEEDGDPDPVDTESSLGGLFA